MCDPKHVVESDGSHLPSRWRSMWRWIDCTQLYLADTFDSLTRRQYCLFTIRRKEWWKRNCDLSHIHQNRDHNYKVIVNREICTNAVFFELIENDGLKMLPHSHPFKVPWIKSTALGVKQTYLVPIDFHLYFWRILWHIIGTKLKFSLLSNLKLMIKSKSPTWV